MTSHPARADAQVSVGLDGFGGHDAPPRTVPVWSASQVREHREGGHPFPPHVIRSEPSARWRTSRRQAKLPSCASFRASLGRGSQRRFPWKGGPDSVGGSKMRLASTDENPPLCGKVSRTVSVLRGGRNQWRRECPLPRFPSSALHRRPLALHRKRTMTRTPGQPWLAVDETYRNEYLGWSPRPTV